VSQVYETLMLGFVSNEVGSHQFYMGRQGESFSPGLGMEQSSKDILS
jgi:hypothetical protein